MAKKLRFGAISIDGTELVPLVYEALGLPSCGRIAFLRDGRWGFVDYQGREVIPAEYDFVWSFKGDAAAVEIGGTWKSIGLDGEEVEGFRGHWSEGRAVVTVGGSMPHRDDPESHHGRKGYIDKAHNMVVPIKYSQAEPYSQGLGLVQAIKEDLSFDGSYFLDLNGEVAIGPIDTVRVNSFASDGMCRVMDSVTGFMRYLDTQGEVAIDTTIRTLEPFSEGRAACTSNDPDPQQLCHLWGFLDESGEVVIAPSFRQVDPFHNGHAWVQSTVPGAYWELIDRAGTTIISTELELRYVKSFSANCAPAAIPEAFSSTAWGVIRRDGSWAMEPTNAVVSNFLDGVAIFKREDDSIGLVTDNGEIIADGFTGARMASSWPLPMTKAGRRTKTGKLTGARYGLFAKDGSEQVRCAYLEMYSAADEVVVVGNKV